MKIYLNIILMLKSYFLRYNTIDLMIVEHETLSFKNYLLLISHFTILYFFALPV